MLALARTAIAALAVLISIAAALLQLYAPIERALPWRSAYFGTLTEYLAPLLPSAPQVPVRLLAIDEESIRRSGEAWPWSEARLRALTDRLQAEHPRLLSVDLSAPAPQRGEATSWSAVSLDPMLAGNLGIVQAAWGAPAAAASLPLIAIADEVVQPSFELMTALAFFHTDRARIEGDARNLPWPASAPGIHSISAGNQIWSTNPDASLRLLPEGAPTGLVAVPAWRVTAGDPAALRELGNSLIVVRRANANSADAGWQRAQGLAQLINGLTPARAPWAGFAEAALALLAAAGVALLMLAGRARPAITLGAGAALAAILASAAGFFLKLQLVDPIAPIVFMLPAFLAGATGAALLRAMKAEAGKPKQTLRIVGAQVRGTERREVSILVCKIREIETVTEAHPDNPQQLGQVISTLLAAVAEIARTHHGTVEHVSAAGLVAVFNAPSEDPKHTEHATEAALAMLSRLEPLNEGFEKLFPAGKFTPLNLSIGIECADALIGDLGLKAKGEMSALGPAFDWARTLADRAQNYGPAILVGPGAQARIHHKFALLQIGAGERGEGIAKPFYALMGNPVLRANPRFKALQEGFDAFHTAYRKGSWEQAGALLAQCAKLPGANPRLVELYERRLDFLKTSTPDANWDGVLRLPFE